MRKFLILSLAIAVVGISLFYMTPVVCANSEAVTASPATAIIQRTITVCLDGEEIPLQFSAFINAEGRAMISLNDYQSIFAATVEKDTTENTLLIRKGSQEFLLAQEDYLYIPSEVVINDAALLCIDQYYLPLRFAAEQLGYKVSYNYQVGAVILRSIDYQGPDPQFAIPEPQPPELPSNLSQWGSLADAPVMKELWPTEDIIAGYYTKLINSPAGRTHNIALSCGQINGKIIKSGEVCSFNNTVGERTAAAGYQTAAIFVGKKVVPGIGGGICQTATTLYNCVLESQMPVLERHRHSLPVTYIAANRDATISWGTADLKFKNSLQYPLKILAQVYQNYVICAFAAVNNN